MDRIFALIIWPFSAANQTKSSSVRPENQALIVMQMSMCLGSMWCKCKEWRSYSFLFLGLSQSLAPAPPTANPTFYTCWLALLSSSAPCSPSHSHSPSLLLSNWSVASGSRRYLSMASEAIRWYQRPSPSELTIMPSKACY